MMHFFAHNKKLVLSIALNIILGVAFSMLLYLVYPQFIYELESVTSMGRYSVRTYRTFYGQTYFEILFGPEEYDGRPKVLRRIYSCSGEDRFSVAAFRRDMMGTGLPNLVIDQYLGGAHGPSRYLILELDGSVVKKIDAIDGLYGPELEDLNDDGICEITCVDGAYGYF